jgi:hypothetical protein
LLTKEHDMVQALALAAEEQTKDLPMEPLMYGVIAIVVFVSLLGLTWTFRGSSNKRR